MALTPGTRLGPYEVLAQIGAGGMGEVYKARDTRLDRMVAIKILPSADPERRQRFEREAKVIAVLSHPNICTLYDVGLDAGKEGGADYLVVEYLEGETLADLLTRGPLALDALLHLGGQVADALDSAHAAKIIHRDLKPSNIFVTTRGQAKVLDFGLAKLLPSFRAHTPTDPSSLPTRLGDLTMAGTALGTVAYMSPEQARGDDTDERSDIFSFGAVLYEMATGRQPFQSATMAVTYDAILNRPLADPAVFKPDLPAALVRLIVHALEKDRDRRHQSAAEMHAALEAVKRATESSGGRATASPPPSIAVLPFANMSAEAENQFFSDGLAEELINALVRLPGLQVASRTSAFRFRAGDVDIREIGRQLHVTTVLEGSVRRVGNRLRVTAQLINISDGYHLWSERYDREMADVFAIQDEIVEAIVKSLAPALVGEAKGAVRRPTENIAAYELYLQGRHSWHQRSPNSLQAAIHCFEQVIALDPEYALAYAGLADCYAIHRVYGWFSDKICRPPALAAVARAVALDPSLAEVHYSKALVTYYFERHWRPAESHIRRALAINPRLADVQGYLGLVLSSDYRSDEAVAAADRARELDPLSPFVHYLAAVTLNTLGQFESGELAARRVLELQPDSLMGLWPLSLDLSQLGRHDDAISAGERMIKLSRAPFYVGVLGFVYARGGRGDDACVLVRELEERGARGEYVAAYAPLIIQAALGDVQATRRALKACIEDSTPPLSIQCSGGPVLDAMRGDPEIDRLLDVLYDGARRRPALA